MFNRNQPGGRAIRIAIILLFAVASAHAQSAASAYGKLPSLWAGVEYSNFQAGFPVGSSIRISGLGAFANFNWNHALGAEARVRFLDLNTWNGETQRDFFFGPRYTFLHSQQWRPFASFQVGLVQIHYPFSLGNGTSFALDPGAGLEYRLNSKWSARVVYDYQILPNSPNFTNEPKFGIRPNGASVGISYRIF